MNKQSGIITFGIVCLSLLASCTAEEATQPTGDLMLMYQESEPGIDPYPTRVLVNKQFLRMDDGADQSNFTLYDRSKNIIYTVTHEEKTILQIKPVKTENKITRKLVLDARKLDDGDLPSIEGKKPVHYQLLVNGKLCSDVFVIKDLHSEAMTAMREFRNVLASIHLSNNNDTPEEMLDECFLAHDVLAPSRSMQFGFPISEHDVNGVTRLLVDFKRAYKATPDIYKLPTDYRIKDMAGASVEAEILSQ